MPTPPEEDPWDLVLHPGFRGKSPVPAGWPHNPRLEHQLNRVRAAMTPKEYDGWLPGFLQRMFR